MKSSKFRLLLVPGALLFAATLGAQSDWPTFGYDGASTHHSPLKQIDAKNVSTLTRAWTYHLASGAPVAPSAPVQDPDAPPARGGRGGGVTTKSEATPLVVGGIMYLPAPSRRVIALEPETGKLLWSYDLGNANASTRGVEYYAGDGAQAPSTIFFGTTDGRLVGLNAKTGKPVPGFGAEGFVDLKAGGPGGFSLSSPPKVVGNVLITGARVQESPAIGMPGDTRGWDARTGKLLWTFHSVPQPGEPGHETWRGDDWKERSGTNVWGLISVDSKLGMVYLPHGAPSADFYGGDRIGDNLYGNSLVALDATTGKMKWYFQAVHHDTWDFDLEAAPILFEMKRGNTTIPAVALTSKTGFVFMLDRRDGKPLYNIEERPVPPPPLPGDEGAKTEPWPVKPAPMSRLSFTYPDDIAKVTPEHEAFCRSLYENGFAAPNNGRMHNDGPFTRYSLTPTIQFPGTFGSTNWHGGSYDPDLAYLFFNTVDLADVGTMSKNPEGKLPPYFRNGFQRFWNPAISWPCQTPPWGEMVAINVNTGEYAWRVPLGTIPELDAKGVHNTGALNIGGSMSTATGLLFISATGDHHFRAFDEKTGKIVWDVELEAGAYAAPMTYLGKDGKQYVAIVATGGSYFDHTTGDSVIAFKLP